MQHFLVKYLNLIFFLVDYFSSFYSYDFQLKQKNKIFDNFFNNIYEIGNKVIFSNGSGYLCFTDDLFNWNLLSGVNKVGIIDLPIKEVCLYHNNTLGILEINKDDLEIKINEKTYSLELYSEKYLYPNIKIINKNYIFHYMNLLKMIYVIIDFVFAIMENLNCIYLILIKNVLH